MATFWLALFLGAINLLVVCGNLCVLYILVTQKQLHTSTNTIVFSLTLSDFMLGCLILPFSILQEFSHSWSFGTMWCKSWLSLDILFSTASIYNLLAISFDRYMAVKQPIKYGRLISSSRLTKFTISAVWLISAGLAVPPFLSDLFMVTTATREQMDALLMVENNFSAELFAVAGTCTPVTNSDAYILFSASVSFILPMILMVGLNASIFCTVLDSKRKLSHAASSAFPSAPASGRSNTSALLSGGGHKHHQSQHLTSSSCEDMDRILRVHRGGSARRIAPPAPSSTSCCLSETYHLLASNGGKQSSNRRSLNHLLFKKASFKQPTFSLPPPSSMIMANGHSLPSSRKPTTELFVTAHHQQQNGGFAKLSAPSGPSALLHRGGFVLSSCKSMDGSLNLTSLESPPVMRDQHCLSWHQPPRGARLVWLNRIRRIKMGHQQQQQQKQKRSCPSAMFRPVSPNDQSPALTLPLQLALNMHKLLEQERLVRAMPAVRQPSIIERTADRSVWFPTVVTSLFAGSAKRNATVCRRQSEKLLLYPTLQFAKSALRTELRVARTIAVVVGCFTACWLPFSMIYVLQAFQLCPVGTCIPDWLFTLAFWLGYANSALNPILYAAFSRDFRNAFKKILTFRERNSSFRSNS